MSSRLVSVVFSGCLLLLPAGAVFAQPAPSTDIFLLTIERTDTGITLGKAENLTNRDGYDNQPHFSKDGKSLYYTAMFGEQTDIVRHDLARGRISRVAVTPESEYSPTPIPGEDALSVIRVEADGTQRLWRLPLDGGKPSLILPDVKPVGYHAWSEEKELVLFVLGEPHELVRTRPDSAARKVGSNIGRALHSIPGEEAFSFIQKNDSDTEPAWTINRIDTTNDEVSVIAKTFPGREDVTWSPDGRVWMANDSRVAYWCEPCGGWQEVADLEDQGLRGITRLAIDPEGTRLALVAERPGGDEE